MCIRYYRTIVFYFDIVLQIAVFIVLFIPICHLCYYQIYFKLIIPLTHSNKLNFCILSIFLLYIEKTNMEMNEVESKQLKILELYNQNVLFCISYTMNQGLQLSEQ